MPLHTDIESLDPDVQGKVKTGIAAAGAAGYGVRIVEAWREYLVQVAYRLRGLREQDGSAFSLTDIEFAYKMAGLPKPDPATARLKCTSTLQSNHLNRRAVDVAIWRKDGKPVTLADWKIVAKGFTDTGATWGKDWDRDGLTLEDGDADEGKWIQDAPHFEWR